MHNNVDTVFSNTAYCFLCLRKITGNCHASQVANRCSILRFFTFYRGFQKIQLTDRCPLGDMYQGGLLYTAFVWAA